MKLVMLSIARAPLNALLMVLESMVSVPAVDCSVPVLAMVMTVLLISCAGGISTRDAYVAAADRGQEGGGRSRQIKRRSGIYFHRGAGVGD